MTVETATNDLSAALSAYADAYDAYPDRLELAEVRLPSRRPWVLLSGLPVYNITPEWYARAYPANIPGDEDDAALCREWETEAEEVVELLNNAAEIIREITPGAVQ